MAVGKQSRAEAGAVLWVVWRDWCFRRHSGRDWDSLLVFWGGLEEDGNVGIGTEEGGNMSL